MTSYEIHTLEQFFLTVGQNNFGNKIPFELGSSLHSISRWNFFSSPFHALKIEFLFVLVHKKREWCKQSSLTD